MKKALVLFVGLLAALSAFASDEISLFDRHGRASAYIAVDDDLTIYTWSGKPVAYLQRDNLSKAYHVWGFNGKHLGWFSGGVIRDDEGSPACAVKERLQMTQLEPLKSLKGLRPLKSLTELAPLRPLESNTFGDTPCGLLLTAGR